MQVKSPITFRRKNGEVVFQGSPVDASEIKRFQSVSAPEPYETKVVREVPADVPRAVAETRHAAAKPAAAKPAKAAKKTAKKAK